MSSTFTLGPVFVASGEAAVDWSASKSAEHFENDSRASARPAPTFTEKTRSGFFALSDPENVRVCVEGVVGGGGGGAGADATTAVAAELADVEPPEFVAVTTTFIVEPTSASVSG